MANKTITAIKLRLSALSFKTGLAVLALCVVFYVISFAQMALPIHAAAKGVLWTIFFGLAKTAQYAALAILGADGIKRIRGVLKKGARD